MPETKWIVYACGGFLCGVFALLSGNVRRTFFTLMVLALQANVTLMLAGATGSSYVGSSGPSGFMIPLTIVIAAFLLCWHWLTAGLQRQRFQWSCGSLTVPGTLFLLGGLVSIFWAPELRPVLFGLQEPIYGYLLCLAAINLVRSRADLSRALNLLLAVLAIQSVIYYIQNLTGVEFNLTGDVVRGHSVDGLRRFGGTVSTNPKGFAMFISVLALTALSAFLGSNDRRLRRRSALVAAMGVSALVLTFTRAAWIGFMIGASVVVFLGLRRSRVAMGRVLGMVALGALPVLALLPMVLVRLSSDHAADYEERAALMRIAWRIIASHPLAGVGTGAYGLVMRDYLLVQDWGKWLFIVHNAYLLRWAETGIFGLLSLLFLWFAAFRLALRCTRSRDEVTFVIGLGCCAGFTHLCWEMWWDIQIGGTTPYLFWFMVGLLQAAVAIEDRERATKVSTLKTEPLRVRWAVA